MGTINLDNLTGLTENYAASQGSSLDTGDLRRRFGVPRISELSFRRDPWFYLTSRFRKKAQEDAEYKFWEVRESLSKRYAYVVGHGTTRAGIGTSDATLGNGTTPAAGDTYWLRLGADYKTAGNIQNVYDEVHTTARSNAFDVGDAGTAPKFLLPGHMINVNVGATAGGGGVPTGYYTMRIENVYYNGASGSETTTDVQCTIKSLPTGGNYELCSYSGNAVISAVRNLRWAQNKNDLASKQTHIIGSSFAPGTGYPEGWYDNPYSSGMAYMQIFKTALEMDEETMATVFKMEPNEWLRVWGKKLIEHNLDIERALHFSHQGKSGRLRQCQGIVDYVLNYGQLFDLDLDSKTSDDFLEDLSQILYPGSEMTMENMIYLADTPTFNWLNMLGGLLKNNVSISTQFRADIMAAGTARAGLLELQLIKTPKGTMALVEDVHLNSSPVKIVGMSLDEIEINPLVGNGKNRDTSVYAGIQSLAKDGIDVYASLIQTQLGQSIRVPSKHVAWLDAQ